MRPCYFTTCCDYIACPSVSSYWVEPEKLVDTNWSDRDDDEVDDYPHSCLDFTFVAGKAKLWHSRSRVIVRDGDFPDDDKTSDHRPVELVTLPK